MRRLFPLLLLASFVPSLHQVGVAQSCPQVPTPTITSPLPPSDVCIPDGFSGLPIDYFDDYSWRAFVALVWPTAAGQRGVPDTAKTVGAAGPRVFDTYKALWEIFHPDGSAPSSATFNDYEKPDFNACKAQLNFGDLVLASFSKFSDLGQAAFGTLVGPLADQHGHYVRYLTMYSSSEFDFIRSKALYLRSNIPPTPTGPNSPPALHFPNGSIDVKVAWIDMTGFSDAQRARFYTREATVLDPTNGTCSKMTVGLVGLHIVSKTPSRPQWIWSTFEQVDNVPPAQAGFLGFTFNNGNTNQPMPASNPLSLSPLNPAPPPFNVVRIPTNPIHPNTAGTNTKYRALLAGTIWQNYQLVMTQWPIGVGNQPVPDTQSGAINNTFPGSGAASAFANTTMETFDQASPRTGCMNCHNSARLTGDFLWSMLDHAFPPSASTPDLFITDTRFRSLREILEETKTDLQPAALRSNKNAKPTTVKQH